MRWARERGESVDPVPAVASDTTGTSGSMPGTAAPSDAPGSPGPSAATRAGSLTGSSSAKSWIAASGISTSRLENRLGETVSAARVPSRSCR